MGKRAPSPPGFPARLRQWRNEVAHLTQDELAERIGGTAGPVISKYENGRRQPSVDWLERLHAGTGVDLQWLLTGHAEGTEVGKAAEAPADYTATPDRALLDALAERLGRATPEIRWIGDRDAVNALEGEAAYQAVPFAEDAATAGAGAVMDDQIGGYVMMHESVMRDAVGEVVCVRVAGDSMEPTLTDGSIVAVDRGRRDPHQAHGRIVLARGEDGVVLKRWRRRDDHVMLESDNPEHRPIVLCPHMVDEHTLIGVAFWAWVDLR